MTRIIDRQLPASKKVPPDRVAAPAQPLSAAALRGFAARVQHLLYSASGRALLAILAIAAILFFVNVEAARVLRTATVWQYYDILFDSDPNTRIWAFTHAIPVPDALHKHLPASVHPFFPYIASPFVIGGADAWSALVGARPSANQHMREMLALLVSPVSMAGAVVLFGVALLRLRLPALTAVAGAGLVAAAYSSQVFGALPEHYALGALSIAALLAWLATWLSAGRPVSRRGLVVWVALAAFATGVTVTHIAVAGLVLWAAEHGRRGLWRGLVFAAPCALAVVVAVTMLGQLAVFLHETFWFSLGRHEAAAVATFIAFDAASLAGRFLAFAADSLQALIAIGIERRPPLHVWAQKDNDIIRTLAPARWPAGGLALVGLMLALVATGAWRGLRAGPPLRAFTFVAIGIVAFNALVHAALGFGIILFLYAQHWLAALVTLIVLNLPLSSAGRGARALRMAAVAAVALIAVSNAVMVGRTTAMAQQIIADHVAKPRP